ncbi:MAG: hypothetical protein HFG29_05845 [Eubacterium sp.]|nr:hypothetical protein [Eubacterium sp.]
MRKNMKKSLSIVLSLAMALSVQTFGPADFQKVVKADENLVTAFRYDYAYSTPGYADGTIYINANEDGVYKVFWGDENGNKLKRGNYEYSYLARVVVKDGAGAFNIINDYTAIPEGAKTVVVYKQGEQVYTYNIPADKQFKASEKSYTFGSLSDPHFTRYSSVAEDDAVPAMDKALEFLDNEGIRFVAMSGDLSQAGEQLAFDRFNEALAKHPDMTVLTAIGNHDSRTTLSTSNKSLLDTSVSRWYNSITSTYFTVDEDGIVHNKLNGHEILANDALINPIATVYKETEDGEEIDTTVPGLDFVTEAGGNIFIFFNNIAKTGEVYDTDKLVTTGQMDWLEEQLENYKDKNVFLYQHYYLGVNTLENDAVDYNNCTGDLKNTGNYSYDLDFKDVVKTTSGKNLQSLLTQYKNATLVTGHSHWQYSMQELNKGINFGRLANGNGGTMIHLSSVTEPRYIADEDANRTSLNGYASEGSTVTTYEDCTVYNNIDFQNEQYEAYATYIVPTGNNSQYEPIKNADYTESTSAITGDSYLDAEDMTELQLLKSDFNLLKGAAYTYSSKGTENTDTALTDGLSTGTFCNTKWGAKTDQRVTVTLDGVQDVSNLKSFMLYYVSDITASKKFNIQLSLDGENFETIYTSKADYSYKNRELTVDTSGIQLTQYQYVRLNMLDGAKDYGFQIRELAAIGYERNSTPNMAGSASTVEGGAPIDESEYLNTDYNLIYAADYTQSSEGNENKAGALTDGKTSGGFVNTERSSSAKEQTFVIDLGKSKIQKVNNIDFLLLYNQNGLTNVTHWDVSISLDGENYETIGTYSDVEVDQEHFDVDLSDVTLDRFRYVKLHFTNGNTGYGYQIKEFAIIGVNPVEYPEIADQTANVASVEKNLALNKPVYVSSTYANEGKDKAVLTDGKKDKYWSSDWDSKRTSDWVVIDLGEEIDASLIGRVLVNYKSDNTFCGDYTIQVSKTFDEENPGNGFYEIGKTKAVSWEIMQKNADVNGYVVTDISDVESDMIRYLKVNMNGHATYGFQIYEVAVLKKTDIANAQVEVILDDDGEVVVEVKYNNKLLVKNSDYTYSISHAGSKIEVTVTGVGEYGGSVSKTIDMDDMPLSEVKNLSAECIGVGNVKVSFEEPDLLEGFEQTYDIYCDDVLLAENQNAGTYEYYGLSAGGHVFKVVAKRGDKVSDGVTIDVEIQGKDLTKCTLNMEEVNLAFNGEEQTVPFTVTDGETQLEEDVDFTVSYKDNIDAGTATLIVTGIGTYEGQLVGEFKIGTVDIESDIVMKDFSKVDTQYEYKKMEIQPIVKMKQGDYNLSSMKDFEVEYINNLNPGIATITLRGIGNYTGTITKTFTISKRLMSNVSIKTKFENNQLVVTVNVPDNGRTLEKDIDYTYTTVTDETGKITITLTGIGSSCEGSIVKVIEAEDNPNRPVPTTTAAPKKVSVKKATIKKAVNKKGKKVKISWKKVSGVAGYNIRYALSKKKLKKAKIKKIKKNKISYTIKKLKKKKYFIQVRAYKVVDKKTYYGAWSKVKKVTVKK